MAIDLNSDERFMREAIKLAQQAHAEGEIPVGAVVVANNQIIAKGYNQTERLKDPTAHAEMIAITSACNYIGTKYLTDCSLYVTLEPCGMCAGGLYWAQLKRLVFGARDEQRGYSVINPKMIHPRTKITSGILAEESAALILKFFAELRKKT
ncbi:MAG: nucleoside deaminase [Candidatus Cyclobacteriaceae bacterium M2_1C_046]